MEGAHEQREHHAGELDEDVFRPGALDVLAQHVMACACSGPFREEDLLAEVQSALPYSALTNDKFARGLGFIRDGGYSLRAYDRFKRLTQDADGTWRVSHPRFVTQHRLNAGIIVEATLRLVPALPDPFTAIATFPDERSGLQTVADFMAGGGVPSLFEFLDGASLRMLNDFGDFGLDGDAGAMLIMQVDDNPTDAEAAMSTFTEVAERCGALDVAYSDDPSDSAALITARRMIQPAYEKFANAHGGGQLLDDVCLPRTAVPEFCDRLAELRASSGLEIALVAHAGDGNMHPSVFFDSSDAAETEKAEDVFAEIMRVGLELGGTITGEHGVGFLKRAWLPNELDEGSRRIQLAVKNALDPLGILNPGKMLAEI